MLANKIIPCMWKWVWPFHRQKVLVVLLLFCGMSFFFFFFSDFQERWQEKTPHNSYYIWWLFNLFYLILKELVIIMIFKSTSLKIHWKACDRLPEVTPFVHWVSFRDFLKCIFNSDKYIFLLLSPCYLKVTYGYFNLIIQLRKISISVHFLLFFIFV